MVMAPVLIDPAALKAKRDAFKEALAAVSTGRLFTFVSDFDQNGLSLQT